MLMFPVFALSYILSIQGSELGNVTEKCYPKQVVQDTEGKKVVFHLRSQAVVDPRLLNLLTFQFSLDLPWQTVSSCTDRLNPTLKPEGEYKICKQ